MSVRAPPANFCFLLLCEEVGGRRNIELARWVSMDILRAKLLPKRQRPEGWAKPEETDTARECHQRAPWAHDRG